MTAYHVRLLCEGGFEGPYNYTPAQVGEMTLDQIIMLLVDKKNLRTAPGEPRSRIATVAEAAASLPSAEDGLVAGRDAAGNPMRARIGGESLAARIRRENAEKREADARAARRAERWERRRVRREKAKKQAAEREAAAARLEGR